MGYTTNFDGQFKLDREISYKASRAIQDLDGNRKIVHNGNALGYCQWQLTDDGTGIEWDGGEKFYDYVDWLEYIIKSILIPNRHTLNGTVSYSGESTDDNGVIVVNNNVVRKIKNKTAIDELADARRAIAELTATISQLETELRGERD